MIDVVTLWDLPTKDFQAYQDWIGSDLTLREYHARLTAAAQEACRLGYRVQWLRIGLADFRRCMERNRLANTPAGRAVCVGLCFAWQESGEMPLLESAP